MIPCAAAVLALAFLCAGATPAGAQHINAISRAGPVMVEVERLVASGVFTDVHIGQHSLSARELQRMVRNGWERLSRLDLPEPAASRARASLEVIAGAVGDTRPGGVAFGLHGAGVEGAYLGSESRAVRPYNGLGYIDARVNPLGDHAGGRTLSEGSTAFAWASASASAGDRIEATVQGRGGLHDGRADTPLSSIERLVVAVRSGNAIVAVGRDHVRWGQGLHAATMFAAGAPPLELVRVSTDAPVRLPWLLGLAGPVRATIMVADMTGPGHFDGEWLAAWKVSAMPWPHLELGATVASQQGGRGSPPATFAERVADLLPLIDAIFLGDRDLQSSNKLAGADIRVRVPQWGGFTMYVDGMLDDMDLRRIRSTILDDGAWVAGLSLPPSVARPVGITVEQHHTGLRFYRHGDFRSGVTHRGGLLGNPLGPDADAAHLQLVIEPAPFRRLLVNAAVEHRRANTYTTSGGAAAGDGTLRFHLVERHPEERRLRATVALSQWLPAQRLHVSAEAGGERVTGFAHVVRSQRTNGLVRLAVERRF